MLFFYAALKNPVITGFGFVSGESDGLIEAVELKDHPFFIGVQFHPEFTSRLTKPNPVITGFLCDLLLCSYLLDLMEVEFLKLWCEYLFEI